MGFRQSNVNGEDAELFASGPYNTDFFGANASVSSLIACDGDGDSPAKSEVRTAAHLNDRPMYVNRRRCKKVASIACARPLGLTIVRPDTPQFGGPSMDTTDVKIFPVEEDRLRAYVTITLDQCFVVRDLKVINGASGLFVAMPQIISII